MSDSSVYSSSEEEGETFLTDKESLQKKKSLNIFQSLSPYNFKNMEVCFSDEFDDVVNMEQFVYIVLVKLYDA